MKKTEDRSQKTDTNNTLAKSAKGAKEFQPLNTLKYNPQTYGTD